MKMYAEREYFLFFKTLYCKYLSIPNHELHIILTLECIGAEGREGAEGGGELYSFLHAHTSPTL